MEGFTIIDGAVALVIVVSALLAYARGFVREVMAIIGWVAAGVLAYMFAPQAEPLMAEIPVVGDFIADSCELSLIAAFFAVFAIALIVAVAMLMGLYALFLLWRTGNARLTLMEREYWRLHQRASERGRPLAVGLTPMQLSDAISEQWPQAAVAAENWAKYYQKLHYDPVSAPDKRQRRHLRSLRNRLYKLLD